MKSTLLVIISTIDFFKSNAWIFSIAAIFISFASLVFVIIDKIKNWKENSLIKKLKKDKAILEPIVLLNIKDFCSIRIEQKKYIRSKILEADYSNLYNIFQSIITNSLSNRNIAEKIEKIKNKKDEDLMELNHAPESSHFSHRFSQDIIELIHDVKMYLAIII